MNPFQALVLGVVQGLTEFVPVSSSGHLTLVPFVLGWDEPSVAFDVALHVGTVIAVVWALRDRVEVLWRTVTGWRAASEDDRQIVRFLAIATVPAVVVGAILNGPVSSVFERPVVVSLLLGVTGYILMNVESRLEERAAALVEPGAPPPPPVRDDERTVDRADAIAIGIAQAVAILPGISRSGSTIAVGMWRGLSRPAAARFSFLLSIPIIVGAAIFEIPDLVSEGLEGGLLSMLVGVAASAVTGVYVVRWLLDVLARKTLRAFGTYCFFAMVAGLLTALARG